MQHKRIAMKKASLIKSGYNKDADHLSLRKSLEDLSSGLFFYVLDNFLKKIV